MKKTVILLIHAVYWLLFLLLLFSFFFFAVMLPYHAKPGMQKAENFGWGLRLVTGLAIIPGIISFYSFYTFLFNQFLARKKFLAFFACGILLSVLTAITGAAVESLPFLFGPKFLFGDGYNSAVVIIIFMSFVAFVSGIIGVGIKGFINWYNDIKLKESLNRKNHEMELALLKSKINPHFLFNTINNIDILITKDAALASSYLNNLSDIMRFMLYETDAEKISIDREISYIDKYIALQKIRTSNKNYVQFAVKGNAAAWHTAPMLFIPFIENAFKHTENNKAGSTINIQFIIEKDILTFNCENSFSNSVIRPAEGGLGNQLIRKRLLLLYSGKHILNITNNNNIYKVKLELYLHGN